MTTGNGFWFEYVLMTAAAIKGEQIGSVHHNFFLFIFLNFYFEKMVKHTQKKLKTTSEKRKQISFQVLCVVNKKCIACKRALIKLSCHASVPILVEVIN